MDDPINTAPQSSPDQDATAFSAEPTSENPEHAVGKIGPYNLLVKLGEGGMGAVWLADQTSPVKRRVAIKVVKSGVFSEEALKRFDLERQSLALMNHPAIAKVFDAGSTAEGYPYFVMEYVSGAPITTYCNRKHLGPRERIELMIQVCEGVQHAHQKAIMHRDLKPSNILVTEIDGKPVPRIIDFGIAKAVENSGPDATLNDFTQAGGTVGTLGYMSPEQADPSIQDVDTRTDVYSLGVVLYELLTASLPFDTKSKLLHEVVRQLHEEDPQLPSTRVGTGSTDAAKNSGTDSHKLVSQLRGDLDWITMKALERERDRRYSAPSDFAADLSRYLRHETVTARPPSAAYRASKFIRRNRLAVAFAGVVALLIVGFAISMTIARNRARREAETSKRVSDFMANIFKVTDPGESRGNAVTARELLDKAAKQIETELNQDPQVQARLVQTMAESYIGLGLHDQAHELLEHAVATQTRILGADNPTTLQSMALLGKTLDAEGHYSESAKLLRQALAGQERVLGPENPETMNTVSMLTDVLNNEGKLSESEGLIRRTIATQQRTLGPANGATLRSMRSLMANLHDQGRFAEAEKFGQETIVLEERVLGADHPGTLWSKNMQALTLQSEGHYAEAEKMFREVLEVSTRVLGPNHINTLAAHSNIGLTLQSQGRLKEAEALQIEDLQQTRKALGPDHPATIDSINNLAMTYGMENKLAESEKMFREALEISMRTLGPTATGTRNALSNLATTLAYEKRADQAIPMFEKVLENAAKAEGTALRDAHVQYAAGLVILSRLDPAIAHLREAANLGFTDTQLLTTNDDLKPLRNDPRFQALVAQIQKKK